MKISFCKKLSQNACLFNPDSLRGTILIAVHSPKNIALKTVRSSHRDSETEQEGEPRERDRETAHPSSLLPLKMDSRVSIK